MAKKKSPSKKKKSVPPGVDPNEKRRERLEARRRAKAEALAAKQRAERRARIVRLLVYAGLLAVAVWFFLFRGADLPSEIQGHEVTKFNDAGLQDHAAQGETVSYAESPPVAGRHAPTPASCGTYEQPVPNENLVHSLEHGAVALLYAPDAPIDGIRTMEEIARESEDNVLSAPYEGEMETPFSVVSWGERMDLQEMDEAAVREYVDAYRGQGPETGAQPCENDEDEEFEPPEPEATETPEPEVTPGSTPAPEETATPAPKRNKGKASKPTPKPTASS